MKRDLKALSERTFDVLVVGCGVYGAFVAREAALRGLSVAVIDAGDFCGATSANSLKIIHGGLRYLQQLDVIRTRESAKERRILMRLAPHLVHPLSCIMPTTGWGLRSKPVMRAGLLVNDLLSFDRNRTNDLEKRIPSGKVISREECLRILPGLESDIITGAAKWHDAFAYNTERLALGAVVAACRRGAVAANYVRLVGFTRSGRDITGIVAKDVFTGSRFNVSAKLVINASGPWVPEILSLADASGSTPIRHLVLAMNFVLKRQIIKSYAAGLTSPGTTSRKKSLLFFAPWRGKTIAGTYYRLHTGPAGDIAVSEQDISIFLDDLNRAYPPARLERNDIAVIHAGLQPAESATGNPKPVGHYEILDHSKVDGIEGLLTVVGVKYTTARDVAAKTVAVAMTKLGCCPSGLQPASGDTCLPGGELPNFNAFLEETLRISGKTIGEGHVRRLVMNYGTEHRALLELYSADASLGRPTGDSPDVIGAEIVHAVRSEMVQTLADVVFRRTDLGSAGMPDERALLACADLVAREAGWDAKRKTNEIARTLVLAEQPTRCCVRLSNACSV